MPGASQQTRRVKTLNANWVPDAVGGVLRSEMVDKSTSHLQTSFGPVFYPETVQTGLLLPE